MMLEEPEHYTERGRRLGKLLLSLLLLLGGVFIGRYIIPVRVEGSSPFNIISLDDTGERMFTFPTFWEAWDILHTNYIGELNDKDLFYGAVAGMIRAAGDPYTVFADPKTTKQFEETLQGHFSGVGIEVGMQDGVVTVIAPLAGSPADQAGIHAEDVIVAVDNEPVTSDMTINDIVQKIRGPRGEKVLLTVARRDENQTRDFEIVRDTITIESVVMNIEEGIAHIRISSFNGDTTEQFNQLAVQARRQGATGIILDMRNNPGGFLATAVEIASAFFDPGTLVVSERGKEHREHTTTRSGILRDVPVVVLVNKGSASASEILAGVLQEKKNASVIGMPTFGKGSVQELIELKDGSSLRVTVAKWYTPNGRSIDDEGISPTIEVGDNPDTDEDEQFIRAREELLRLAEQR